MPRHPTFTTSIQTPWMLAGMAYLGACTFVVMDAPDPAESLPAEEAVVEQVAASCVIAGFPAPHRVRLIDAIAAGDMGQVRFLLAQGTDPNTPNAWGETPLHTVSQRGEVSAASVELLLAYGTDKEGASSWRVVPPLMDAIRARDAEAIRHLLQQGTNPNPWDWAVPPYEAISRSEGDARIVELLMTYGAAPNALTKWAITPLLLARQEMVEVLCRHGARNFLCSRQRHALQSDSSIRTMCRSQPYPGPCQTRGTSQNPKIWSHFSRCVHPRILFPREGSTDLTTSGQTVRYRAKIMMVDASSSQHTSLVHETIPMAAIFAGPWHQSAE